MRFRNRIAPALAAAMLAMAAPIGGAALAEQAPAMTIEDEQLAAFVNALQAVDTLEQQYSATLADAESEAERQSVIEEANEAMANAIEETPGITLDQYIAILQQAQSDPALTERIMGKLEG